MQHPYSSISCNLDRDVLLAALPLFENEQVEAIEWSFDTLYRHRNIPDWFVDLLKAYSVEKRLIGHGVFYSLFTARWSTDQQRWLDHLSKMCRNFSFDHITEHFGFMTGEDFHNGAPMNIPYTKSTLALGRDRLQRMQDACQCPVGLENLAFAYTPEDVERHGYFLESLIEPVNGFVILDLHNLYCQAMNFGIDAEHLLQMYPLQKVREIHISGGSWEPAGLQHEKTIRRDTHDHAVPPDVFILLKIALQKCPATKFVVLEQIGSGLKTEVSRQLFRDDFTTMKSILQDQSNTMDMTNSFLPHTTIPISPEPYEDEALAYQQIELATIFETATDIDEARLLLRTSSLADTAWNIEAWDVYMMHTAMQIAQKWKSTYRA